VVGAGRGPLVSASIRAAAAARVRPRVVCVEKNQNALVTLAHRRAADPLWRDAAVEVVGVDMRGWAGPAAVGGDEGKADVLVSELLGSLGDNELSPGARAPPRSSHVLKACVFFGFGAFCLKVGLTLWLRCPAARQRVAPLSSSRRRTPHATARCSPAAVALALSSARARSFARSLSLSLALSVSRALSLLSSSLP
jgi:hypothetical protein